VRGTGYNKVYDFYESLNKSFDAYLGAKNHTVETHVQCMTLLRSAVDSFLSTAYASIVHGQDTKKINAAEGVVISTEQGIIPVCAIENQEMKGRTTTNC
jgi:hypothetical protein